MISKMMFHSFYFYSNKLVDIYDIRIVKIIVNEYILSTYIFDAQDVLNLISETVISASLLKVKQ